MREPLVPYNPAVPLPYVDIFAKGISKGDIANTSLLLQRILNELELGPHSVLGFALVKRDPLKPLQKFMISDIFEPVVFILGPPEFAGKPYQAIQNLVRAGKLKTKDVKYLGTFYDENILGTTGEILSPKRLKLPDLAVLTGSVIGSRNIPLEVVPLINPGLQPIIPPLSEAQSKELFLRYMFLQILREALGLPRASEITTFKELYPAEKLMRLIEPGTIESQ